MQAAQWLQTRQALKAGRQIEPERHHEINEVVNHKSAAQQVETARPAGASHPPEPPEQQQRSEDAELLVPLPALDVMKSMPQRGLVVGRRTRRIQEYEREQQAVQSPSRGRSDLYPGACVGASAVGILHEHQQEAKGKC